MNLKYKLIAFFMLLCGSSAMAQLDQTMYNMRVVPQSIYLNPALIPTYRVNIGLPVISSLYYNGVHTGFYAKDLVTLDGDSAVMDVDNMVSKLGKQNYFTQNFQTDILHVGFRTGDAYVHFNMGTNVDLRFSYPKDFMELAWKGNGAFLGRTADLGGLGPNMSLYHEIGIGYARPLNEKFTIGGKARLLMGIANIYSKKSNLSLFTDETTFALTAAGEFDLNMSGIYPFPFDSLSDYNPNDYIGLLFDENSDFSTEPDPMAYFMSFANPGFGIDLGASYDINDKFTVSGSVVDLGMIGWKRGVANMRMSETSFTFTGLDIASWPTDSLPPGYQDTIINELLDSIEGKMEIDTLNEKYTTPLTPRFTIAGNFNINEKMNAGVVFTGEIYRGNFRPAITASYSINVGRFLTAQVNWSYMNRSPLNVGGGLALNGGPVQLYVTADNLISYLGNRYMVPTDSAGDSPMIPIIKTSKTRHIHAGINITMGREKRDRDGDGLPDKEDDCPDTPGLMEFQGCPDTDGDKIPDIRDACPEIPGVAAFQGCPDTDMDGITDTLDACPLEAGPLDLAGCPDRDNDKTIDKEDACPDEFGPKVTKGCPDKDLDGVLDRDDLCPEKPGPADHKGCPDTDGDGLYDNEDRCVEEFGPIDNLGCPYGDLDGDGVFDRQDRCVDTPGPATNQGCPYGDIDGDGVTDNIDDCPNTPGPASNKGCPEVTEEVKVLLEKAAKTEFESGKAIIRATSYMTLDTLVQLLMANPEMKIELVGHTDDIGTESANLTLSKNRTMAISKYFTDRGVDVSRVKSDWKGESQPKVPNTSTANRQINRRVDMKIVYE